MNQYKITYQAPGQEQPGSYMKQSYSETGAREDFESSFPGHEILDVQTITMPIL